MGTADPLLIASAAAQGFPVLQCQECAERIKESLVASGYHGRLVTIKCGKGDFIVCLSYDGGQVTISRNGTHKAVRIGDLVFDNLHAHGVPFEAWFGDFDGVGGISVVSEADF